MAKKLYSENLLAAQIEGDFYYRSFGDGTRQYLIAGMNDNYDDDVDWITLERVERPKSRRRCWAIVNRYAFSSPKNTNRLYPDKLAGPFKSLAEAKSVYLTLMALRGVTPTAEGE